jgi:hypothetical protein
VIDLAKIKRDCLPMRGLRYSSSKSTQELTTVNRNNDGRVVGGDSSSNASITGDVGGSVNIVATDHGAITAGAATASKSLDAAMQGITTLGDVAKQSVKSGADLSAQAMANSNTMMSGALSAVREAQADFTSTMENVKSSDVRVLVVAGLAVVGIAATKLLKG